MNLIKVSFFSDVIFLAGYRKKRMRNTIIIEHEGGVRK
jgi:hypothetical protein